MLSWVYRRKFTEVTRPLSPQQARWLLLKPDQELEPEQRVYPNHVGQACPVILIAKRLIVAFFLLVRERPESAFAPWLTAADARNVLEFVEFAKGLVRDRAAVERALR